MTSKRENGKTIQAWDKEHCCDLNSCQCSSSTKWFSVDQSAPKIQWVIENATDLTEIEFVENVPMFSTYKHNATDDELPKKEEKCMQQRDKVHNELKRNEKRQTGVEEKKLVKKVATSRFGRTRKVIDFSQYDA